MNGASGNRFANVEFRQSVNIDFQRRLFVSLGWSSVVIQTIGVRTRKRPLSNLNSYRICSK